MLVNVARDWLAAVIHYAVVSQMPAASNGQIMNSIKLVIPLHSLYWSIHTKDESKRGTAFAFIFGVN